MTSPEQWAYGVNPVFELMAEGNHRRRASSSSKYKKWYYVIFIMHRVHHADPISITRTDAFMFLRHSSAQQFILLFLCMGYPDFGRDVRVLIIAQDKCLAYSRYIWFYILKNLADYLKILKQH
ncbi:hypothetical protein ACJX0J_022606, partial [Zea mays]